MIEDIVFRGVEFSVKIEVIKGVLIVEISELLTADQWRGEFDPACEYYTSIVCSVSLKIQLERVSPENLFPTDVEDLTRKTGNFKQFPIFCSMLESAVRKVHFEGLHTMLKNIPSAHQVITTI